MPPARLSVGELQKSEEYLRRARRVLPGGVNSNIRLAERPIPLVFTRARGPILEDVDGNTYIDYVCGMGPIILGHADPRVTGAVVEAIDRGLVFGGTHLLEIEVAERIAAAVPSVEVMRFCSSGSEAVHAAIRIARAATGRWKIARFEGHYHGWLDTIYIGEPPDPERPVAPAVPGTRGQPRAALQDVIVLPWNDPEALRAAMQMYRGQIAAVILEPILCNTGVIPPRPGYVEAIREWCDRDDAVLIFDEVITGFRVALGGAQSLLGITPDLTVFGKAVANGFPLSVVGGRGDLMEPVASGAVLHGGTYNGNLPAMAAARATLDALAAGGGAAYQGITATGRALMEGLRNAGAEAGVPVLVQGPGPVFHMWITPRSSIEDPRTARTEGAERYAAFAEALVRRGVRPIPGGRWYLSAAHTAEHVAQTVHAAREALVEVRNAFPASAAAGTSSPR
ncbi:MAG: aspartate aminotransferase family protein [Bacillati bacterium ANGP1]|uniref:Aspartate aminotransferase family protein n=1 Tax=Candidatus Segetimicrobium genomatis TaxID=2569760 RepID=A0A537M1K0_9BACT|nr:MAG: aspartate aminotransferase family protein [Terrabacteria group bacterium ANGP1]